MQVSATLIAAQQAAREARARLQLPQVPTQAPQQAAKASFAAALEKTSGASREFSPLPLKQTVAPQGATAAQPPQASGRMGQHVNIIV